MQKSEATFTQPSDQAIDALSKFCSTPAPSMVRRLPSSWVYKPDTQQTMIDFLYRLRFEAMDIVERGDSLVPAAEIAVTMEDTFTLLSAAQALSHLQTAGIIDEGLIPAIKKLSEVFLRIEKYYEDKVRLSKTRREQAINEMGFEDLRIKFLRAQGQKGIYELFELDRIRDREGLKNKNGSLNFLVYKDALQDLREQREMHITDNPQLLGKSPQMGRLMQEAELLNSASERNREVLLGVNECKNSLTDAMWAGGIFQPIPVLKTLSPANQ